MPNYNNNYYWSAFGRQTLYMLDVLRLTPLKNFFQKDVDIFASLCYTIIVPRGTEKIRKPSDKGRKET